MNVYYVNLLKIIYFLPIYYIYCWTNFINDYFYFSCNSALSALRGNGAILPASACYGVRARALRKCEVQATCIGRRIPYLLKRFLRARVCKRFCMGRLLIGKARARCPNAKQDQRERDRYPDRAHKKHADEGNVSMMMFIIPKVAFFINHTCVWGGVMARGAWR